MRNRSDGLGRDLPVSNLIALVSLCPAPQQAGQGSTRWLVKKPGAVQMFH